MISPFDPAAIATNALGLFFFKSSALLVVGTVLARLVSRSAARSALVWTIVFGALIALPAVSGFLPAWELGAVDIRHDIIETRWTFGPLTLSPALCVMLVWVAGAGLSVLRIARDWAAAAALARRAMPIADERAQDLLRRAGLIVSCARLPQLRETCELPTAAVIGWRRPVILLPHELRNWSDDETLGVLCHEMEHIRRNDWPAFLAERFVAALYWPNPLVHVALRISAASREQAADDAVLRGPVRLEAYAARLIAIARGLDPIHTPVSALAFASPGNVDARVRALFASSRDRGRVSGRFGVVAATVAIPIVMTLAVAQPWACLPGPSLNSRVNTCS